MGSSPNRFVVGSANPYKFNQAYLANATNVFGQDFYDDYVDNTKAYITGNALFSRHF